MSAPAPKLRYVFNDEHGVTHQHHLPPLTENPLRTERNEQYENRANDYEPHSRNPVGRKRQFDSASLSSVISTNEPMTTPT
jgi:hypothetical protein